MQPVLMFGVQREVVALLAALAAFLLVGFRLNFVTASLAVTVITVGLPFCRRLTKADPWVFQILRRHLVVAGYYRSQAHPRRRRPVVPTL